MIKKNQGVTLIELGISIAILGILSIGTFRFFRNTFDIWWMTRDSVDVFGKSRSAMNEITRYVRQTSEDPIEITGNSSIKFKISRSTQEWGGDNTIKYFKSGDNLYRMMRKSTTTLIPGGVEKFFIYMDTEPASNYAHVGATLTVTQNQQSATLSQRVMLRGRKINQ